MRLKATLEGVEATIQAVNRTGKAVSGEEADRAVREMGLILLAAVKRYGAVSDGHGPDQLAEIGHPYARARRGKGNKAASTGTQRKAISSKLGHPGWWVHKQSGQLLRAFQGKTSGQSSDTSTGASYDVFADPTVAKHAKFVIQGTRVMFGRDVIFLTSQKAEVKREMIAKAVEIMGKTIRARAPRVPEGGEG